MRYYIADNHFFHAGLLTRMDRRGFTSAERMNEYMISQWNNRVRKNDEVVILGDFSIGKGKDTNEIAKQLNGKLFLVLGNHDKFIKDKEFDESRFQWIKPYAEMNDNGRKVILSHYPIMTYNGQFRKKDGVATTWMLHGHTHLTPDQELIEKFKDITKTFSRISRSSDNPEPAPCQIINCFCMVSDYVPLTLDEWIEIENSGKIKKMIMSDWRYDNE